MDETASRGRKKALRNRPWAVSRIHRRKPSTVLSDSKRIQREQARDALCKFIWKRTGKRSVKDRRQLTLECAVILHGPICAYEASLARLSVRRAGSALAYERAHAGNSAVSSIKRLQRHASKGGYHWEKAWLELSPAAFRAIVTAAAAAAERLSLPIGAAPEPSLIAPFLPKALEIASSAREWTSARDAAVIAILQVYQTIKGRKPPSPKNQNSDTIRFIQSIEDVYRPLLPRGFGVSRSKGTLDRLIALAMTPEA